jgi:acetylglutamate kinase
MSYLVIVKIGGNVIDDDHALERFVRDFSTIKGEKILVHGGGRIATTIADKLGIKSQYVDGRRITDSATIDVVTMVYAGLVNKRIVAMLQKHNCNAIGLSGADANVIAGSKRPVKEIDYGFVGDIDPNSVAVDSLKKFLDMRLVPVVAPIVHDQNGQLLNTNADTIASVLAVALSRWYQVKLVYCFEKQGVLASVEDDSTVVTTLTKEIYNDLRVSGNLFSGIIPKIDNAFNAIDDGVSEVLIGSASDLLINLTPENKGTSITR